jgi:hypothetical protein
MTKRILVFVFVAIAIIPVSCYGQGEVRPEAVVNGWGTSDQYGEVHVFGQPSVETVRKFADEYARRVAQMNAPKVLSKEDARQKDVLDAAKDYYRRLRAKTAHVISPSTTLPQSSSPAPQAPQK